MRPKFIPALLVMLTVMILLTLGCKSSQFIQFTGQAATPTLQPRDNPPETPSNSSADGNFSLIIKEAEVNSWVVEQLNSQSEKFIYNPKVFLREGYIEIDGQIKQPPVSADVTIKLQVSQGDNGKIKLNLMSANFGDLPVPPAIINSFINSFDINNLINTSGASMIINKVEISEGFLKISGIKQ